jgi:hypothetical protein
MYFFECREPPVHSLKKLPRAECEYDEQSAGDDSGKEEMHDHT